MQWTLWKTSAINRRRPPKVRTNQEPIALGLVLTSVLLAANGLAGSSLIRGFQGGREANVCIKSDGSDDAVNSLISTIEYVYSKLGC